MNLRTIGWEGVD